MTAPLLILLKILGYICTYTHTYTSLSLSIYIYIHTHIYIHILLKLKYIRVYSLSLYYIPQGFDHRSILQSPPASNFPLSLHGNCRLFCRITLARQSFLTSPQTKLRSFSIPMYSANRTAQLSYMPPVNHSSESDTIRQQI